MPADEWLPAVGFWTAQVAWWGAAFSAHNFYRSWWLGMGMLLVGLALSEIHRLWEARTD